VAGPALLAVPGLLGAAREELCDVNLCPDSPDNGSRCEKCPLGRLDAAQHSEAGQLLRRALDLRAALRLGVSLSLDDLGSVFPVRVLRKHASGDKTGAIFPERRIWRGTSKYTWPVAIRSGLL